MNFHPSLQAHLEVKASLPGGRVVEVISRGDAGIRTRTRPWMEADIDFADNVQIVELNRSAERVAALSQSEAAAS